MVEQAPEEGRVTGSTPVLGTLSTSGGKGRRMKSLGTPTKQRVMMVSC